MNRKPLRVKRFQTGKNTFGPVRGAHGGDDPRTATEQADEYKIGQLAGGYTTRTIHPDNDDHEVVVEVY